MRGIPRTAHNLKPMPLFETKVSPPLEAAPESVGHCGEKIMKFKKRHGCSGGEDKNNATPEYKTWLGMMDRCRRDANYTSRGILVCEHWKTFENFLSDMGTKPSSNHSIERIDNNGNYEPGNCRWATGYDQANNTRRTCRITFKGRTQSLSAWCLELGLNKDFIYNRMYFQKMSFEEAVSIPKGWKIGRYIQKKS